MIGVARPLLGLALAIAITSTMDATGLTLFSALPLLPLMVLFWWLERFPRAKVGFVWGRWVDYGLAALYPLVVLTAATAIAFVAGAAHVGGTNWGKAGLNLAAGTIGTIPAALLTEEGFFRGWLWASFERAGLKHANIIVLTSIAFALWHLSEVTLAKGFTLPPTQVAIFLVNAVVIGAIWGLLRLHSGSVVVTSVSHGLWSGGEYALFGVGTRVGALGITDKATYGAEVGIVGLMLNLAFAFALWMWWRSKERP
jgi:membrane protease YdiL (CAAX protease family)